MNQGNYQGIIVTIQQEIFSVSLYHIFKKT